MMAMSKLCHPIDEFEVMYLRAHLAAADIPFTIVGENFGSLFPGAKVSALNERVIMVSEGDLPRAKQILNQNRAEQDHV